MKAIEGIGLNEVLFVAEEGKGRDRGCESTFEETWVVEAETSLGASTIESESESVSESELATARKVGADFRAALAENRGRRGTSTDFLAMFVRLR